MQRIDADCAKRLLACSPCTSYLLASQLVALCAVLDGGTVYGMPEAPGGVLAASTLQVHQEGRECDSSAIAPLEAAVWLAGATLLALPSPPGCQMPPGAKPTSVSQPMDTGGDSAFVAPVVPLVVPETAMASSAGGTIRAESHARGSSAAPSAVVPVLSDAAQAGRTAASLQPYAATGQATVPPTLLLDPTVRLEVSLRLVTALCRKLAPTQFDAQGGIEEGHYPEAGQARWLRQLREVSSTIPMEAGLKAAFNALLSAWHVLSKAKLPHARQQPLGKATHNGGACAAAASESVALSPLERWWGGAVALGRAVAGVAAAVAAAARVESDLAQEFVGVVDKYFGLMEEVMKSKEESREPPVQPSESVAAALNAGLLPCLERLLRAVLPLPLASKWAHRWDLGWDAAWAQMLAFADAGEVAAVVDAGAEGLRRAISACSAASRCQGGSTVGTARSASADSRCVWQLKSAAHLAFHLIGNMALVWLPILARELASEPNSPAGDGSDAVVRTVAARLGESLSHVATRLLPEVSRALLGGLLPLFRRGVVGLSSMCGVVGRQLQWVPTLVAVLAASSASSAAPSAAANGSTDGGGCSTDGGGSASSGSTCAARWRQLLFVELRLPSLLGVALELSLRGGTAEESEILVQLHKVVRTVLRALAALVPADLARMVAAADRAEAAAACRMEADRSTAGAAGAAAQPSPSPPSSGLLRRALAPGGPLEDAELLETVEAACAGCVGAGAGMPGGKEGNDGFLVLMEAMVLGARLLVLHG